MKQMRHYFNNSLLLIFLVQGISSYAQQVQLITTDEQRSSFENKSYLIVKSLTLKPGFSVSGATHGGWYAKVHPNAVSPTAPSSDQNFVRSETILTSGITTETQIKSLSIADKATSFTYSDGIGKVIQNVSVSASPALNDAVQPAYYDAVGRPTRQYLPYVATGTAGTYRTNALADQGAFYNTANDKVADDTRAYSETVYDNLSGNIVAQSMAPGAAWTAKPKTASMKIHDASVPVRSWDFVNSLPVSSSTYPAGSLTISESQNEESMISRTYADFMGRTILKEVQSSQSRWAQTYYVYNLYNNLVCIIPPAAVSTLNPDLSFAARWYYQFEYDNYQRKIGSKAPGAGWVYTIYDQWDRPVLTQDANQRAKNPAEWNFVKYDEFNRAIASGIYKTNDSRAALTTTLASFAGRYETRNNTVVGYTLNQSFPTSATEADLFTISYFDNYTFLNTTTQPGWDAENKSFAFVQEAGYTGLPFLNFIGFGRTPEPGSGTAYTGFASLINPNYVIYDMPTGGKTKVLNSTTNQWLNNVNYYDDRYRPIQSISENHFGALDRVTSEYDFSGKGLKSKSVHNNASAQSITLQQRFTYDLSGRVVNTYHQLNSQPEVLLSSLAYNELGQVVKKKIHSTDNGSTFLQAIDYRYDIHGALVSLNSVAPDTGDPVDYFGMELGYEKSLSGNTPRYDGMISGTRWNHDNSGKRRAYNYTYDKGALTAASYKVDNAANTQTNVYNESGITYDLNGNIQTLNRNGGTVTAATVDQLAYNYGTNGGNQLMKVTDSAPTATRAQGFTDGNTTNDDYAYDANGNVTKDLNKGISSISYNLFDKPDRITFTGGSCIAYTYTASGGKLTQAYFNSSNQLQSKTDYTSGFLYVDGQPQMTFTGEGRLVTPPSANLISNTATREASSLEGYTAKGNVTLTSVTVNADTYVKAVANETGTPGIAPIGGTISVKPGESYSFKVMGYQSIGTAAYLYVSSGAGDIVWTGAQLPIGTTNGIVTSTFTVPAGVTQISVGVRWNGAAVGNTVFINRVMLYRSDWEYQYFLSDHLGSPRVVLQTAPHTFTYTATMESQNYSDNAPSVGESSVFLNLKSTNEIVFTAANATVGGTRAYVMNSANRVGPGKSFKVFPGDKIDASAMGYYIAGGTYTKTAATAMGGAISSILGVNIPGAVDALGQAYSLAGNGNAAFAALSPDKGTSQPSAFINYILFDDTFTPIEGKSQSVGGTPGVLSPVNLPTINVNQTGYLYVYLSYDNDTGGADVYFDEFKITYQESPVIQVNSYYPFGLTAFSWLREGETENKYLFQGKELESLTGLQDFGSRMYWGDLGRWFSGDPQNQFASGYVGMGNNPVMMVDPDGEFAFLIVMAAGAVFNLATNWDAATKDFGSFVKYAGIGAVGGLAASTGNFALAGAIVGGGNTWAQGGNAEQIMMGAGIGAISGAIGGAAGGAVGKGLGGFAQGFVQGAVGGAAGGFTGGFLLGTYQTGDIGLGFQAGIKGGVVGGITGGVAGGLMSIINTRIHNSKNPDARINYINGQLVAEGRSPWSFNNTPRGTATGGDLITLEFGENPRIKMDYDAVYADIREHGFSRNHLKDGLGNLGSKDFISLDAVSQIERALPMLREGNNMIITRMNGKVVTIRANVHNGVVRSGNIFVGTQTRNGGNFIYLSPY